MRFILVLLLFVVSLGCGSFEIVTRQQPNTRIYSYEQPYYYEYYRPDIRFYQYYFPRRYYVPYYYPYIDYNRYSIRPRTRQSIKSVTPRSSSPRVTPSNPKTRTNESPRSTQSRYNIGRKNN